MADLEQRLSKLAADLELRAYVNGLQGAIGTLQDLIKKARETKIVPDNDESPVLRLIPPKRTSAGPRAAGVTFAKSIDKVLNEADDWLTAAQITAKLGWTTSEARTRVAGALLGNMEKYGWTREKDDAPEGARQTRVWYYTASEED